MSRSIHTTQGDYERRKRFRDADPEVRQRELDEIRDEIRAKRAIKRRVRAERDDPRPDDLPPIDPASIPIRVLDDGPAVCHAVSETDLRAVMANLPAGVLDGVSEVVLSLGTDYQEEGIDPEDAGFDRDPWLDRRGAEVLPGVWGGRFLGTYRPDVSRIDVYAYAVDPALADRPMWEFLLRLWGLSTFVHEVAHHDDAMRRVARGRWRMAVKKKVEDYAEALQAEWTRDVVVPYLERAYPAEVASLYAWMTHHGGLALPLALVAGHWAWDAEGRYHPVYFGSALEALVNLAEDVLKGSDPIDTHIQFARDLHYGENYAEAQAVLAGVVAEHPDHPDAVTLQADILEHLGEYAAAEALALPVVTREPGHVDAWMVLADVYEGLGQWERGLDAAERGMRATESEKWPWRALLIHRLRALLELGRYDEMEPDLATLEETRGGRREAFGLRALMLLRRGDFVAALAVADEAITTLPRWFLPVVRAVRFEASARLGRPLPTTELRPDHLASLRRLHHGAWVDRLVAEFGLEEEEE